MLSKRLIIIPLLLSSLFLFAKVGEVTRTSPTLSPELSLLCPKSKELPSSLRLHSFVHANEEVTMNTIYGNKLQNINQFDFDRYRKADSMVRSGGVLLTVGLGTVLMGWLCFVPKGDKDLGLHKLGVGFFALGGTCISVSIPLICCGNKTCTEIQTKLKKQNK